MTRILNTLFLIPMALSVVILSCGDDTSGTGNTNDSDASASVCGNGTLEQGEACDDGEQNSDAVPDACRTDCRSHFCGDEVMDSDETCDDGDRDPGDGCDDSCQEETGWDCSSGSCVAICGDNIAVGDEQCDGTDLAGATCVSQMYPSGALGCTDDCSFDFSACTGFDCGDGEIDTNETCDDGNTDSCDGCSDACQVEECGNLTVDCGEACDDGNLIDGDGCNATCSSNETCGNGLVDPQADEVCDCGGDPANLPSGCLDANGGMGGECTQSCLSVHAWSDSFGSSSNDRGSYVAVDPNGRIAIAGAMQGTVTFGTSTYTCQGYDVFVLVLDANGAVLWSKQLGGTGNNFPGGVAFDSAGRVLVAGTATDNLDLGGGTRTIFGDTGSFIVALDTNGNYEDDRVMPSLGGTNIHTIEDLAVDSNDNVIAVGRYTGRWWCFSAPCPTDPTGYAGFVIKYDSELTTVWDEMYDSINDQFIDHVAVDSNDNVIFGGIYRSYFVFGGDNHYNQGATYLVGIVAKLTSNGSPVWSRAFTDQWTQTDQTVQAVAVGPNDQVVVAGYVEGDMRLATGVVESSVSDHDAYLVQYDASGTYQWHVHGYGSGEDYGRVAAVDSQGRVWFGGQFESQIELGGGPFTASGTKDLFLAHYDSTGAHMWSRQYGLSGTNNIFNDMAISPTDQAVVVGTLSSLLDIGGGNLPMHGFTDAMIGVYNP